MRSLILGAGFIGRNLAELLLERGREVRAFDRCSCPDAFRGRLEWHHGAFEDNSALSMAVKGADIVYHMISSTVPGDRVDEVAELHANVFRTIELLRLCTEAGVGRVVFLSSASVYGPQEALPIPENAPTDPISSHGIQKLTIEKYLQLYKYEHGLDCRIMRLANPYGPWQNPHGRQGLIGILIGKLLDGEPMTIRGDGSVVRDFIHVRDVARACLLLAESDSSQKLFNISSGEGHSILEVLDTAEKVLGRSIDRVHVPERRADIPKSVLSIARAERVLGFSPTVSLEAGMRETFLWNGIAVKEA